MFRNLYHLFFDDIKESPLERLLKLFIFMFFEILNKYNDRKNIIQTTS